MVRKHCLCVAAVIGIVVGCRTDRPADNPQRAGGAPTLGDQSGPSAAGGQAEHGSANGGGGMTLNGNH